MRILHLFLIKMKEAVGIVFLLCCICIVPFLFKNLVFLIQKLSCHHLSPNHVLSFLILLFVLYFECCYKNFFLVGLKSFLGLGSLFLDTLEAPAAYLFPFLSVCSLFHLLLLYMHFCLRLSAVFLLSYIDFF